MKFDLKWQPEIKKAYAYLIELDKKNVIVEIIRVSPKRTLNQNSYLHLIIGAFAEHFGYTLAEGKEVYKDINKDIYYYKKKQRFFKRSSADLTVEEMAKSIDRFREASAGQDFPLPLATDQKWLREIENEIERSKHYL